MAIKKKSKSNKTTKTNKSKYSINKKLDKILSVENKLLMVEKDLEKKEDKELAFESKEESDLEKLERIEKEIKNEIGEHPLAKITYKDVVKGLVGSFVGLAIHYTFVYGVKVSEELTMTRATLLFPLTFLVGLLFIYATGFRKVKDKELLWFMPIRLVVLYVCSLVMSLAVLYLFYPEFGQSFEVSYKMTAGVMLAAVVGACTADLFGKE
jgi:uncharacterized membrane protein